MPGVSGYQDFWLVGGAFHFKRESIGSDHFPWEKWGVVKSATPTMEATTSELKDPECGVLLTVDRAVTELVETWSVEIANLSPDIQAFLFMSSPPEEFTQTTTPEVDVPQEEAHKGELFFIINTAGDNQYMIDTLDAVKDSTGVTTYDLGDDYEIVDLERGLIRIVASGDIVEDDNLKISFTPLAISGKRLVNPQSQAQIEGKMKNFLSRNDCKDQTVREARVSIVPSAANFSAEEQSSATFEITVLADTTGTEPRPAGRLLSFKGDIPAAS